MAIDVDGRTRRDLPERDQAFPQRGLEIQSVLEGYALKEAVLRSRRREKAESGEQAEVGAADRIHCADADRISENRLKYDAQGDSLVRDALLLGRPQRGGQAMATQLQEVRDEEENPGAG